MVIVTCCINIKKGTHNDMFPPSRDFSTPMRWLLLFCGPMNVAGAVCFAPPITAVREQFGLPEPPTVYLWILSSWILAFGVAYFLMGWSGIASRGVLAIAAWGKAIFAGMLIGQAINGTISPIAGFAVFPDFALAVLFAVYLWRTRPSQQTS